MEPWYKVVTLRKEVREGRSFNPDEFAIALEQVVAGRGPEDYKDPEQFFSRTCWTRALRDHAGMVLRRLSGKTENTAPILTLITQFGGGKTHTLTALYHLANTGKGAIDFSGVESLLDAAELAKVPRSRVGVFVGNAWDPQEGRETPDALARLFQAAGGSVLILFDEVLNFVNRHRAMAEPFYAFIQNLTVAMKGAQRSAAVVSLPRSQVEMTDWDFQWQEKITKVVRRVAKDLIVADEAEVSEVVRRRLFENLGGERLRRNVARAYADWCFWTRRRRRKRPRSFCAGDSRPVTHFTLPRYRSSSGNGWRCRSTSKRAAPWRCSPSGFPGLSARVSLRRGGSR